MNSVQLVGRLVRDPEVRYSDGGATIARFTVAVDRRFKKEGGETADFIPCLAFGKTAEFIEKYFHKGSRIGLTGRIQTGNYTNKDGVKIYTTDIIVDAVEFVESNSSGGKNESSKPNDDFMHIPEGIMEELPFN